MNTTEKAIQAFRRLTAGVSIVSTGNATERFAMTASSVTSLSMDPPSILVCINDNAEITPFLKDNNQMCINLLGSSDEELSNICATPGSGEKRFESKHWESTATHLPYLSNAQAAIFCDIDKRIDYATHHVYIARVVDVKFTQEVDPLVYLNHQYGKFKA